MLASREDQLYALVAEGNITHLPDFVERAIIPYAKRFLQRYSLASAVCLLRLLQSIEPAFRTLAASCNSNETAGFKIK